MRGEQQFELNLMNIFVLYISVETKTDESNSFSFKPIKEVVVEKTVNISEHLSQLTPDMKELVTEIQNES